MGGAFRGMADDPSAMYWNPAGLGFMDTNMANISGAGIYPGSKFTYSGADTTYFNDGELSAEKKLWPFPNIYAIKAGDCKLHYGLGVYVPYGLGAKWDLYRYSDTGLIPNPDTTSAIPYISVPVNHPEMEKFENMSSIGVVDIHPTVSYTITDKLSIGAGISIQYGMIEIQKISPHPVNGWNVPIIMDLNGTGFGYGANMGILMKVLPNLNIGLSGKLPSVVKLDGDAEFSVYPYLPMVTPDVISAKPKAKADLNLPGDIGIGIAYHPIENLSLSFDVTQTYWSCLDSVYVDLEDGATLGGAPLTDKVMNTAWEDILRLSVGAEYWINPANALRCGFFFDQSPIPDESLNPTFPDISDKMSGNFGYSKVFGPMQLDMNVEYIHFNEREITTQTADNLVGTYNTSVFAGNMGITYKF
jgi:long-chain fatty acid transport protein